MQVMWATLIAMLSSLLSLASVITKYSYLGCIGTVVGTSRTVWHLILQALLAIVIMCVMCNIAIIAAVLASDLRNNAFAINMLFCSLAISSIIGTIAAVVFTAVIAYMHYNASAVASACAVAANTKHI